MRVLTEAEIAALQPRMVSAAEGVPVRFLDGGCAVNIETGAKSSRGSNVIYHVVYWRFTRELALEIAKLTGTKAVFSD